MTRERRDIVIVGGGITGLAAALFLREKGKRPLVVEKSARAGGVIRTEKREGFLLEFGPNSTLETNARVTELIRLAGIEREKLYASPSSKNRYIVRNGVPVALPMGLLPFLRTPLLSARGKLRLLAEPFAPHPVKDDETLAEFAVRRVGKEFLDYAVNPFIAGVYAGDPRRLSCRSAMPKLYDLEAKYGGLIKGAVGGARERKRRGEPSKMAAPMFSFVEGMAQLPEAIEKVLGEDLRAGATVVAIRGGKGNPYTVDFESAHGNGSVEAAAVVVTAPARQTAALIEHLSPTTAALLTRVPYAPIAVVHMGYRKFKERRRLDGFGFLVPEVEKRNILGAIFSSTIFPNRAPDGDSLLTVFVGGMRQPQLTRLEDSALVRLAVADVSDILSIESRPNVLYVTRIAESIPQYGVGHRWIVNALRNVETEHRGLVFAGNFREGISVSDCIAQAHAVSEKLSDR